MAQCGNRGVREIVSPIFREKEERLVPAREKGHSGLRLSRAEIKEFPYMECILKDIATSLLGYVVL